MTSLKRGAPATTAYTEIRFVNLLDTPLRLSGTLEFTADGSLRKQVQTPYAETTSIAGGQVTIERRGKPARRFALKRAPELAGFLESFIAVLSGDAPRLQQSYTLQSSGDARSWQLRLTPKDRALAKHVANVEIDGRANEPRCFRIQEADGDLSVLLVDALAAAKLIEPITREALVTLCRAAP
ncbi:MAG: LolA-related protein [Tahibacter sp.]